MSIKAVAFRGMLGRARVYRRGRGVFLRVWVEVEAMHPPEGGLARRARRESVGRRGESRAHVFRCGQGDHDGRDTRIRQRPAQRVTPGLQSPISCQRPRRSGDIPRNVSPA